MTNQASQQRQSNGRSKPSTRAKPNPTGGGEGHPSERPPFPTVAGAAGIKHGPAPRIEKIKGLVTPRQPAHTMFEIQPWQDYNNDAMRLDRINFGGVR